jgi:hypothetical protein
MVVAVLQEVLLQLNLEVPVVLAAAAGVMIPVVLILAVLVHLVKEMLVVLVPVPEVAV